MGIRAQSHSAPSRARMEELLQGSAEGQQRLEASDVVGERATKRIRLQFDDRRANSASSSSAAAGAASSSSAAAEGDAQDLAMPSDADRTRVGEAHQDGGHERGHCRGSFHQWVPRDSGLAS